MNRVIGGANPRVVARRDKSPAVIGAIENAYKSRERIWGAGPPLHVLVSIGKAVEAAKLMDGSL